ncbi:MAG: hypothetical protein QNJ97_13740 [Myxococcota bacterium]|nr:hypothetical protein [Myxococcota bacterium]
MNQPASRLIVTILVMSLILGCSDASLYIPGNEDPTADRLGLTGRVCTDDPREAGFPVRVIFLVDMAAGPIFASFDPELIRLQALKDTLAIHSGNDAFSFAVVAFGPRTRRLAPQEGHFTRNPGELENAVASLANAEGCLGGICRDYRDGFALSRSLIEGDLAEMMAGERNRTQYVVVLVTGGPPDPLACEYECCDPTLEECDASECVPSMACTQTLIKNDVLDIREDIKNWGAASFSTHVLFLAAPDPEVPNPEELLTQTEVLLQDVAFVGAGRYERFNAADAITLDRIGLKRLSSLFEAKSLFVTNVNVLPSMGEPVVDSDGDGLADVYEQQIGTNPYHRDSDGDGIGDLVETLLVLGPLQPGGVPAVCAELGGPPYLDMDVDMLNDCEEILLGTDRSLPDSDSDAVPDWIEVAYGTDYLFADALGDSDGDGASNGDEAREHTDPRSSDAASHLSNAYRYDITDEGFLVEPSLSPPQRITGVTFLSAGTETTGGLGMLDYTPTPVPTLRWRDPQDNELGVAVEITDPGPYDLPSSSVEQTGYDRWIRVEVDPALLPPQMNQELLLVELSERHCLSFTFRNIRLVESGAAAGSGGKNNVFIFFSQTPKGHLTQPGLFRVAHIPVTYHPDTGREPADLLVEVKNEEFVAVGY